MIPGEWFCIIGGCALALGVLWRWFNPRHHASGNGEAFEQMQARRKQFEEDKKEFENE